MKIKIESSGSVKNEGEFKKKVFEQLGISLENLEKNPGKRTVAKLCLNNLWGHFGMRLNKPKTCFVDSLGEFYGILLNKKVENLSILPLSEEMCQMTYNLKDDFVENVFTNNIGVAAFTTAWARLMLYDVLDRLRERVLGYDTDSAWFVEKEGENLLGDSLGELTDELEGDWITRWTATGPKSYAYETNSGKKTCKVKGFTLNHKNAKKINLESVRDLIYDDAKICIENFQILRTEKK